MNNRTFPARDAKKLEDPERLLWLPPDEVVSLLHPRQGMVIADIGSGTGYFSIPFARQVGPTGKVYAVDVQQEMLSLLNKKLKGVGTSSNIELVLGDATRTNLLSESADIVFMANVWHELDHHEMVLKECGRILRKGGRIAILDWRSDAGHPPGPPLDHRISAESVVATLRSDGWTPAHPVNVGKYSHLVEATRGWSGERDHSLKPFGEKRAFID